MNTQNKTLSPAQKEDAMRLRQIFDAWRDKQKILGLPFSQEFVAEKLNMTQGAVSHYLNGRIPLNIEVLGKFCSFLDCDPLAISETIGRPLADFALLASGQIKSNGFKESKYDIETWDSQKDIADTDRVWIDRYDYKLSAGNGKVQWETQEKQALPFNHGFFSHKKSNPRDCKLLEVSGDSMEPYLFDRDLVMIDTSKTTPRDSKIFAVHFEGESFIKQIFKQAGGILVLHSFNPRFADKIVPNDGSAEFVIIGEVIYRSGAGI